MSGPTSKKLSEVDLKCIYLEHLRKLGLIDASSIIASEYSLGQTGRRADLAILTDEFIGVEVKSKSDSLKRLQPQIDAYVGCFDRVVLLVDERHVVNAQAAIPSSVELWSADGVGKLTLVQQATARCTKSARILAHLCTMRQLRRLAPVGTPLSLSRSKLICAAVQLPIERIQEAATETFRKSFGLSSTSFWKALGELEIDSNSLPPLSRFADARQRREEALRNQNDFWESWSEEAAAVFSARRRDESIAAV